MNRISGTKEWAAHSVNCYLGCPHDCRYCYAREMAVRFGRSSRADWKHPQLSTSAVEKKRVRLDGTVMFPTTHDIAPEMLPACLTVIGKLLAAGNRVLIVSKPHLECVEAICHATRRYVDQVLFRFTIGAPSNRYLSYWEPGAPDLEERLAALRLAFHRGFATSVSAEPCLDFAHADDLIDLVTPHVTDSIWFGKMNRPGQRVEVQTDQEREALAWIRREQMDPTILALYARHMRNPLVKWKDSIKKVVGLPAAQAPGLDI